MKLAEPLRFAAENWVEERGPRGGRRWRHKRSGKITYNDPSGVLARQQAKGPKDPATVARQKRQLAPPMQPSELERILNLPTMQDHPPEFARDTKLPGAGKDPDDVGFGVPDLPKEPADAGKASDYPSMEAFLKARGQQFRQLGNYVQHALPMMLKKMSKQQISEWAKNRGLYSAGISTTTKKNVVQRLVKEANDAAAVNETRAREQQKFNPQEQQQIAQRTAAAMKKAPDIKIGDIEFRQDLVPDEPEQIKKQSTSLAEVLVGMPFGDELEEAMDDLAGFSFGTLMEKYGAMGPLIAGAGLLGGSVGGLAGGAVGSLPLAAIVGAGTGMGMFMGLDPVTSLVGNAAVTGYLLSQPKWTHEQEDAWEKEHPALADSNVAPPFAIASADKAAAGLIPKAAKGGASMGAGWAMMPFVGLARMLRKLTGPGEAEKAAAWKKKMIDQDRIMGKRPWEGKGYSRHYAAGQMSSAQIKQAASEFMKDYLTEAQARLTPQLASPLSRNRLAPPLVPGGGA